MEDGALKVLAATHAPVPGASAHAAALLGMASALVAEIDIVSLKTVSLAHLERRGRLRIFRVPVGAGSPYEQRLTFGRALVRQLEAQAYDVVHVRGAFEGEVVHRRKRDLNVRLIYEVASYPDGSEGDEFERAWTAAHEVALEAADLVIVPTQAAERQLSERGWAGKTAVVPPGVDLNAYDWWPASLGSTRRLLYLGPYGRDRDLDTVLTAVRAVRATVPDLSLLCAGDPDPVRRSELEAAVATAGLSDIVTVRGEPLVHSYPAIIAAAELCLAPAAPTPRFQEFGDLPDPLLEYFACKRPVVAAGVPGVSEVLRDEKEGLLYPPGDAAALCEAIDRMLTDVAFTGRVVGAAYDRVRSTFSESARRRRIAHVYEMLIPGSQVVDSWDRSFDAEISALAQLSDRIDTGTDEAREPSTGELEISATAEHVIPTDTSPGTTPPSESTDLPASPTLVSTLELEPASDSRPTDAPGEPRVSEAPSGVEVDRVSVPSMTDPAPPTPDQGQVSHDPSPSVQGLLAIGEPETAPTPQQSDS